MKIEKKEVNTVIERVCDFCEERSGLFRVKSCSMCKRDVCSKCGISYDFEILAENEFYGDYPSIMCRECWSVGDEARRIISTARKRSEKTEDKAWNDWKKKCLEIHDDE